MSDAVLVAIVAAVPSTLTAILTVVNKRKIDALHIAVDGRLTQLLEQTAKASRAAGKAEGLNGA
jgi:hypothetical protein